MTPLRVVLEPGVASMDLALEAPGRRRRRVTVGRDRDAVEVTLPRRAGKAPPAASTLGVEEW
ncbi:MAG: hypothetical protein H6709_21480 [Kofleriaceae bacterium]|nr:hypothetical protein [Kofleriaceae bacterium]